MQHINLEEFAGGAFTTQINRELKKVTENIQDPNTEATAKRRITVVIEFKPNTVIRQVPISFVYLFHSSSKLLPAALSPSVCDSETFFSPIPANSHYTYPIHTPRS